MDRYRIQRVDKRNIAIQELKGKDKKEWRSISFHGNSPSSLALGIFELIMAQHMPADENLLKQLKKLELAMISSVDRIEDIIKEYYE